ncbi:MAG: helix-turn-helix domain-containing protein [Bacteroidales bacterium]|jgi:transcriptional regulator with XRE-family HTH domain|nr:helix-turn-helix domain-containing protein [Bacteroidales bacterium]
MKERILRFLKEENKTSAQFAEEIGVQPSGISHIISGRNNPSLEFVIKMLEKYNFLSTEWLLFGKGEMYSVKQNPSLFDFGNTYTSARDNNLKQLDNSKITTPETAAEIQTPDIKEKKNISKIVWFYDDNTFEEFTRENR